MMQNGPGDIFLPRYEPPALKKLPKTEFARLNSNKNQKLLCFGRNHVFLMQTTHAF